MTNRIIVNYSSTPQLEAQFKQRLKTDYVNLTKAAAVRALKQAFAQGYTPPLLVPHLINNKKAKGHAKATVLPDTE
jgi:hypothetical protein